VPKISVAEDPKLAKEMLDKALSNDVKRPASPELTAPPSTEGELCGWYHQLDGTMSKEFRVRELTGRDEEFLAGLSAPSQFVTALLQRGLVSVGDDKASNDVLDGLLAGDWDTVLLAIRIATFGEFHDQPMKCSDCTTEYTAHVDLSKAPRKVREFDRDVEVVGRHGTVYQVGNMYGSTQRAILAKGLDLPMPKLNSMILQDCVLSINGKPVISPNQVLDMPLRDRTEIIRVIGERRVGPDLDSFVVECPTCGKEDPAQVSLANTFRS
jgi:hypothetical protein